MNSLLIYTAYSIYAYINIGIYHIICNLGIPTPRPYWDAGYSLHELVGFVQREGSFDLKSLKVATSEQLGTLIGDEDAIRIKYEIEERAQKRNEGLLYIY